MVRLERCGLQKTAGQVNEAMGSTDSADSGACHVAHAASRARTQRPQPSPSRPEVPSLATTALVLSGLQRGGLLCQHPGSRSQVLQRGLDLRAWQLQPAATGTRLTFQGVVTPWGLPHHGLSSGHPR